MPGEKTEREEDKGFKISDKRYSVRGYVDREEEPEPSEKPREEKPAPVQSPPAEEPPPPPEARDTAGTREPGEEAAGGGAGREFEMLLTILQGNALAAMGINPQTGGRSSAPADSRTARLFVDMIGMVHKKMQGNLTEDEDRLLSQVLSDLRMLYVREIGID